MAPLIRISPPLRHRPAVGYRPDPAGRAAGDHRRSRHRPLYQHRPRPPRTGRRRVVVPPRQALRVADMSLLIVAAGTLVILALVWAMAHAVDRKEHYLDDEWWREF